MAKIKQFTIEINGIKESVDAVDSLMGKLKELEEKIKALQGMEINVVANAPDISTATIESNPLNDTSVDNSANDAAHLAALKEEERLYKQILATKAKIDATNTNDYQSLLQEKEVLKEVTTETKAKVSEQRLSANEYSNTMQGLKQELKDIKQVMQTTDLGDDKFKDLVERANQVNDKLKDIEQSYGQYGRNVGNYANGVAEGLSKVVVKVGDTERTFESAKQAARELGNELKNMAVNGQRGTKEFNELQEAVERLNSDIKDVSVSSQAMDTLMDTMQSVVAIASTAKGLGAVFGIDDDSIEESIQKLLALQNALQGIEVLFKQMKSGELFGGLFAKGNAAIDSFTKKLFGLNTTAKTTNATLEATGTAGKASATGLGTASVAANTATKSFSLATAAATALRVALSALGIGLVIAAISALVEGISALIDKQKEAKKQQEALTKTVEEGQKAYANTQAELIKYQTKLDKFNGTKKQEKKLVEELNSKYGKSLGSYKTLAEWKKILTERGKILAQVMAKEAEAQALLNLYTENYLRLQEAKKIQEEGGTTWNKILDFITVGLGKSAKEKADENVKAIETENEQILDKVKELYAEVEELNRTNNMFEYAPQIDKESKKNKDAVKKAESELIKLRLELMKDGLSKTLAQLKVEREARIKAARETAVAVKEQEELINKLYDRKEIEARQAHYQKLYDIRKKYEEELKNLQEQTLSEGITNSTQKNENELKKAQEYLVIIKQFDDVLEQANFQDKLTIDYQKTDIHKSLKDYEKDVQKATKISQKAQIELSEMYKKFNPNAGGNSFADAMNFIYSVRDYSEQMTESEIKRFKKLKKEFLDYRKFAIDIENRLFSSLNEALESRYTARQKYYNKLLESSKEYYEKEYEIQKTALDKEIEAQAKAENKRYENLVGSGKEKTIIPTLMKGYKESYDSGELDNLDTNKIEQYFSKYKEELDKWLEKQDEALKKGEITIEVYSEITSGKLLESYRNKEITFTEYMSNMVKQEEAHINKMSVIEKKATIESTKIEEEKNENLRRINAEYYSNIEQEISNFVTNVTRLRDKAESKNAWGIINYEKTKKALNELRKNIHSSLVLIQTEKDQLLAALNEGEIEFADYDKTKAQLDALEEELKTTSTSVEKDLEELGGKWWGSIDQWIQAVGQTANQILSSLSEISSNHYEELISQQEEYINQYEDMLDKQKAMTQEFANAVNDIEDELSTARGDRRQQLIDNLNAEMAAQRASLAQEKKIEKEKQKAEEKKKKLEHDQAVAKKKMDLAQAYINAAMAVSMAAVNSWPIPAIPMMALAAAAGAAQIAAVASQNIPSYGSGGVIQGKSHSQGGVKVLGGRAEVEGGEYITNRFTTTKNVELLEYINSKKKRLNIDDMIEFYSSGKSIKKSVSVVRTKFADGGQIPQIRTDITLSDRLLTAFEDYSNKPTYVSVVDIIDKTERLNEVKTISGLYN